MRQLYIIFFLLISFIDLKAQFNLFPDTLNRNKNIDYVLVKRDCQNCKIIEKDVLVSKYDFDKDGLNIAKYNYDNSQKIFGKFEFYYKNGILSSYESFNSYKIDSENWEESYWDSLAMSHKVNYEYEKGILTYLEWLDDGEMVSFDIVFEYDSLYRIIEEFQIDYSNPNVIELQAFKPNSTEFLDSIEFKTKNEYKQKIYSYHKNFCEIKYYVNNQLTGIEYQSFDSNANRISKVICNLKGDTLSVDNFKYDINSRVIEKATRTIGYDGFGDSYDFLNYDKTEFEYDLQGKLLKEINYYQDKIHTIYKYEYYQK